MGKIKKRQELSTSQIRHVGNYTWLSVHYQGQNVLLPETIPGKGVLEGLRPKENLEKNLEDLEETILKSQEPQLLKGHGEHGNWGFRGASDSLYAGSGEGVGNQALTSLRGRGL